MKNVAVVNARTLAWIDLFQMIPKSGIFYPDFVREVVQHYQFQKFPQIFEQFDLDKGVEFSAGKQEKRAINKLTFFNTLIAIETREGTEGSKEAILELLEWAKIKFGVTLPETIKWGYVSDLFFQTDFPLLDSSPLAKLAQKTGSIVSEIWGEKLVYRPTIMTAGHDPLARKYTLAPFTIQRRAEFRFEDNHYFSEAPLPTDVHIKLLEEFEADALVASQ